MDILTHQQIERILQDVIDLFLIPKFNELGMDASGEWRNSIEVRGNEIWGRQYTEQLVYGRKPGKRPPVEPLKKWAMIKFGYDEKRALSFAFALAHTIAEKGTSWYQQGGTELIAVLKSQAVIDFINLQAGIIIKQQITGQLTNFIKLKLA